MTTIAFDGRTLAADRQMTFGTERCRSATPKVMRTPDGRLLGAAGNSVRAAQFMEWLSAAAGSRGAMPDGQNDPKDENRPSVLEIYPDGRLFLWCTYGAIELADKQFAIGSGEDYAVGAMAMGADAATAVEIAHRFDTNTGHVTDMLLLCPDVWESCAA